VVSACLSSSAYVERSEFIVICQSIQLNVLWMYGFQSLCLQVNLCLTFGTLNSFLCFIVMLWWYLFNNVIVPVFSGTSVPGIAESNDGTGDADGAAAASVKFRGKSDMVIHKGKLLGKSTLLCVPCGISHSFWLCVIWHLCIY